MSRQKVVVGHLSPEISHGPYFSPRARARSRTGARAWARVLQMLGPGLGLGLGLGQGVWGRARAGHRAEIGSGLFIVAAVMTVQSFACKPHQAQPGREVCSIAAAVMNL